MKEAGALLDPTAGAAGRVIDAITAKTEPEAPSLNSLAKSQAAERTVSTSPMENSARQAAEAQMPPAQAELAQRVLAAGNGGLEHYYEGAQPAEFAERAKYQVMAAEFAAEANQAPDKTSPTINATVGPPPEVAKGGPRGFQLAHVQEAAQRARREKGL